ncbi:hypothetical protein [Nocardia neocaledoniensis]|uniref:hypothetical protein n=1 Tax=Nocardia neocaledoniensis TaxID=236511 RepID=UPI00245534A5|nr:hypothetical protein [Nocardia neocaledoniensis]
METARQRCLRYRRDLDLPAVIPTRTDLIAVPLLAGKVDSVCAPASLAQAAIPNLMPWMKGPVVEDVRSRRVVFLVAPDDIEVDHDRLVPLNVVVGGRIALLPSPREERAGLRRWVLDPHGRNLPPRQDILDALTGARR